MDLWTLKLGFYCEYVLRMESSTFHFNNDTSGVIWLKKNHALDQVFFPPFFSKSVDAGMEVASIFNCMVNDSSPLNIFCLVQIWRMYFC